MSVDYKLQNGEHAQQGGSPFLCSFVGQDPMFSSAWLKRSTRMGAIVFPYV